MFKMLLGMAMPAITPPGTGYASSAFVYGGNQSGTTLTIVEHYLFATPGTKGTVPAALASAKKRSVATGNSTESLVFSGSNQASTPFTGTTAVEKYVFATPGTKGSSPGAMSVASVNGGAAGNNTAVLIFGGYGASSTVISTVQHYSYASGPLATSPAALVDARRISGAASNSTHAMVFGGTNDTDYTARVELYVFATPGTKGSAPAAMSGDRGFMFCGSNTASIFILGGSKAAAPTTLSIGEHYLFATPGTKGSAPASLSSTRYAGASAAGDQQLLTFGGVNQTNICEQFLFATPGTKGSNAAVLSASRQESSAASNRSV